MSKIEDDMGLSEVSREKLEHIRELVTNRWANARGFRIPYVPNDQSHCKKIEGIVSNLLLLDTEEGRRTFLNAFTDDEKFLLLAVIWLHDIGMCPNLNVLPDPGDKELRRTHHERSAKFVKLEPELQELLEAQERDRIATICFLHKKSEKIPDELYHKFRLILAYLRLADALLIPDRAPFEDLRKYLACGLDSVSKYHWFKSFYVIYAGPAEKESRKLILKFKKPLNWKGNAEIDLLPLEDILYTGLKDEVDSVKSILVDGKLTYNLPVYTEVETGFDETYLKDYEIAELEELLGVFQLFNPTISPNSGKVIDIILNQLERCVTIEKTEKAEEKIQSLGEYLDNPVIPLLEERPCHAYLWNLYDELRKKLDELEGQSMDTDKTTVASIRIGGLAKIQLMIRALKWWRIEVKRKLRHEILSAKIINKNDSVFLYGYSGSVITALNALDYDTKKNIEVFVSECNTKTKHRYDNKLIYSDGIQYIHELKNIGIEKIYFVPDSCAANLFSPIEKDISNGRKRVKKVFFGANGIDKNTGEVVHSLGHLAIADIAAQYKIPVYVIAEGLKIRENLPKTPENQREGPWYPTDVEFANIIRNITCYNPREDVVSLDKITEIITEKGRYNTKSPLSELDSISTRIDEVVTEYEKWYK